MSSQNLVQTFIADYEKIVRKEVKQKLLRKQNKLLEKKNQDIAQRIFNLQDQILDAIKTYYNHNITDITTQWYIEDNSIHMDFHWLDQEIAMYSENRKLIVDGCPNKLFRFLQQQPFFLEFMLLDQEYYTIQTFPL